MASTMTIRTRCGIFLPIAVFSLALLAQSAAAVDIRYMAFGDSITAAWGFDDDCICESQDCRQACGYPRRLRRLLVNAGIDAGVINEGLGGEKTAEGLTRLDRVLGPGYDAVLLMEGTNDISVNVSPETTWMNLEEMARKAQARGIETIHATLIPRSPNARGDHDNITNATVAGGIRDLAFTTGRRLADPFEVFSTTPDLFERYYFESETDPVGHPNARGFDLLAETFFNLLMGIDNIPPVVGSVEPRYGTAEVSPLSPVRVRLYDFGTGLDSGVSRLFLNDQVQSDVQSTGGVDWQDLVYRPTDVLPAEVTVRVESRDLAFNSMNREVSRFSVDSEIPGPCIADETTMCIENDPGDDRFELTLHWQTSLNGGDEGDATAVSLAPIGLRRGGLFSFFNLENPEVLIKVLDGCLINDHFWVFVAPTTTLGYELRIIDTTAAIQGAERSEYEYIVTNLDGQDAPPVSDTAAFATCDF